LFNFDGRVEEHIRCIVHLECSGSCLQITSRFVLSAFALPDAKEQCMDLASPRGVTLLLGGVRSGKSRYAQQLAARADRVVFIATAERRDDEEMLRKIERHRAERPHHWVTIEEPLDLASAIESQKRNCDLLLIDCLTLFAAKVVETHGDGEEGVASRIESLCAALKSASPCSVVVVSNEVGSGVVPAFEMGRRYRDLLGEINQRVAAIADQVCLMVAGLPLVLKDVCNDQVRP
jgi:adenosylcobinamide kinase / adenosylcobinamide-phosphate guanylyltransferase